MRNDKLSKLIPNAVALAMGIAAIVLPILNQSQEAVIPLLAIGVLCLGFAGLKNNK